MTHTPREKSPPIIFDRQALRRRLERAAPGFTAHDFLHARIAEDIVDRLESIIRHFSRAAFLGPGAHLIAGTLSDKADVGHVITGALGEGFARHGRNAGSAALVCDDDAPPFADGALDLIVSMMSLQTVNDVPGALARLRACLMPDGLLIAAFPGERTLHELRDCLYRAEAEITGGVSPRISPFIAVKDAGALMQRAGLALPVADVMRLPVTYRDPARLLADLRGMGETSVLAERRRGALRRDVLARAMGLYQELYPAPANDGTGEAGVTASFEVVMLTGWAPHQSQQKPLKPGSGKTSMAEAVRQFAPPPASEDDEA